MGTVAEGVSAAAPLVTASGSSIQKGVWATAIMAAIGLVSLIIRQWGPWKKIDNEREATLLAARAEDNDKLVNRIAKLETKIEEDQARHEAERALDRHRLNNALQCLDALFLMFETAPEKASDVITRVKEMRRQQMEAEAVERATIHAVNITTKAKGASE